MHKVELKSAKRMSNNTPKYHFVFSATIYHWMLVIRSGDGQLEFLANGVDTNDDLPWDMEVVDSRLEDGISDLTSWIHYKHTTVSLSQDLNVVVKVPERLRRLIARYSKYKDESTSSLH